ncbi:MAG: hypothetical protein QOD00_3496 [Blastocatellia bacterium]|nr:hypothetical protein [Blastocatellia bacterium]
MMKDKLKERGSARCPVWKIFYMMLASYHN